MCLQHQSAGFYIPTKHFTSWSTNSQPAVKTDLFKTSPDLLCRWNANLHASESWRHMIERGCGQQTEVLTLTQAYSILLEEMFIIKTFFFCLSLFCFCWFFFLFVLSIYFSKSWRHTVLSKYTLYKIYILKVFKLLSFWLSSSFKGVSSSLMLILTKVGLISRLMSNFTCAYYHFTQTNDSSHCVQVAQLWKLI